MHTHEHADDPELDDFVADALVHLESALRERPRPDFHEVVARARREDPAAIDAAMVEESARLATVVPLGSGREPIAVDPELDNFVAGARVALDAAIDERRLAGIPSPRVALPGPRRRVLPTMVASLAIAATIAWMIVAPRAAIVSEDRSDRATQALMQGAVDRVRELERRLVDAAEPRSRELSEPVPSDSIDRRRDTPENAPEGPPSAPPEESRETAHPANEATTSPKTRPPRRTPAAADGDDTTPARGDHHATHSADADDLEAELAALDADAQARWRAGDRRGAEARFRALIDRDPRGRWAQLAYGDLFALARQGDDAAAEVALWREYLARHPRGPHADDARAGLCRRSAGAEQRACWQRYLDAAPTGAYRQQAARALAEEVSEP